MVTQLEKRPGEGRKGGDSKVEVIASNNKVYSQGSVKEKDRLWQVPEYTLEV